MRLLIILLLLLSFACSSSGSKRYSVTFMKDKDSIHTVVSGIPHGSTINSPDITKADHIFVEWNTLPDGSGKSFAADMPVYQSFTVYAQWDPKYTVTFDPQNGRTLSDLYINYGLALGTEMLSNPERQGFVFREWNTSPDGTGFTFNLNTVVNRSLTVYAIWDDITHHISFDSQGGSSINPQYIVEGASFGASMPAPPARQYYNFTGWNTAANGSGSAFTADTAVFASIVVYAQWTPALYTVTFHPEGGTNVDPVTVQAGNSLGGSMPTHPSRQGYS